MLRNKLALGALGCLLLWTMTAAAAPTQEEHAMKAGKKGEITLTQQTKAGDVVLQPDTYQVQHRVKDGTHFVRFVELKHVNVHEGDSVEYTKAEWDKVGEIKCRVEPSASPIKETTVYTATDGGLVRITRVAIKGEDMVHVLE